MNVGAAVTPSRSHFPAILRVRLSFNTGNGKLLAYALPSRHANADFCGQQEFYVSSALQRAIIAAAFFALLEQLLVSK